jgi:hypothetical protein
MKRYGPSDGNRNDSVVAGWAGVQAFAQAAKGALAASSSASPTRSGILDYMSRQTRFNIDGLYGAEGIDYTSVNNSLGGSVKRVIQDAPARRNTIRFMGRS